jgi:hypothetical protein
VPIANVYVPLPPEGVSFEANGTPTSHSVGAGEVAIGRAAETASGWRTVREYVWKWVELLRVAWIRKLNEPSAVGVPEMRPLATVSPGGRPVPTPDTTVQAAPVAGEPVTGFRFVTTWASNCAEYG